jgi:hypothetical protein
MSRKWYVIAGLWAAIWFTIRCYTALETENGLAAVIYFGLAMLGVYFLADEFVEGKR